MAFDLQAAYADIISTPFYVRETAFTLVVVPQRIALKFNPAMRRDPTSLAGNVNVVDSLTGTALDVSLTVGDTPNQNEIAVRFKEMPRDGTYRINVGAWLTMQGTGGTVNADVDRRPHESGSLRGERSAAASLS